jgi:alcohol dehydrogenase YqhD (iron-dependent ADH family)
MFAHKVFDISYTDNLEDMALEGISKLEEFYHNLGIDTRLGSTNVSLEDIEKMANQATKNGTIQLGNFVKLDRDDVIQIYKNAL